MYYVLIADAYTGICFDEENFKKAEKMNKTSVSACFSDSCDAEKFLTDKIGSVKKFYSIKNGQIKGVVTNWSDCENLVSGFTGAKYKSFPTFSAAENYFLDKQSEYELPRTPFKQPTVIKTIENPEKYYAYVDGSFNSRTKVYGYGVVLVVDGAKHCFSSSNNDKEMVSMRNVAGEIEGSMRAIKEAINLGLPEITIYYDYQGIEKWATGEWKCNKIGTQNYASYIRSVNNLIKIHFVKVKAHSGVELNEKVDMLAKQAVGLL